MAAGTGGLMCEELIRDFGKRSGKGSWLRGAERFLGGSLAREEVWGELSDIMEAYETVYCKLFL